MKITVLRLGHRFIRDKRISTHIGLVARALGADKLILDAPDDDVKRSVWKVVENWGGEFEICFTDDWKGYIKDFGGERIHLTMYGININEVLDDIKASKKDKLIIIGGEKVPPGVYSLVDRNIAIGNQPHSEVAALAVFLDRLFEGKELNKKFEGKKMIVPKSRGKKVLNER